MVVDLSELLDLHEEGFAVQTSRAAGNEPRRNPLPRSAGNQKLIHGSGQVIWSDDSGRGGIRFSALPESSRQILKEWLFANLLIACSNHAARTEQLARREAEESPNWCRPRSLAMLFRYPTKRTALCGGSGSPRGPRDRDDFDAVLQLVTERALSLTGASGAALAFLTDEKMSAARAPENQPRPWEPPWM